MAQQSLAQADLKPPPPPRKAHNFAQSVGSPIHLWALQHHSNRLAWAVAAGNDVAMLESLNVPSRLDLYSYWAKMSFWTLEQSAALLVGADPDAILEDGQLSTSCPEWKQEQYRRMFRLLDSYVRMSGVGPNMPPARVIEWALHARIDPPQALVDAVRAQGPTLIEERTAARVRADRAAAADKPLGERERATLLRLVIGMAIKGYAFDPDAQRSDAPKTIAEDLIALGLEISDQTVREKLKEARHLLPGDWKDRRGGSAN